MSDSNLLVPHFCSNTNHVSNPCDAQWLMLYSFAFHVNEKLDKSTSDSVKDFLFNFPDQCHNTVCKDSFSLAQKNMPMEFDSRRSVVLWLCMVENQCRKMANLPLKLCKYTHLMKRWRYSDGRL